jgi:hypothetical protein
MPGGGPGAARGGGGAMLELTDALQLMYAKHESQFVIALFV